MKENTEQHLDKLTRKMMGSLPLESPDPDFTSKLMDRIDGLDSHALVHQPLISKRAWGIVILIISSFIGFIIFGNVGSLGWLDSLDYSLLQDNKISESLSGIASSKTLMYAIIMFGLFLLVQITVLKNYFDKRLQY